MSRCLAILLVISSCGTIYASETPSDAEAARLAAESWIAIVDGAEYERSWEPLSEKLRQKVSREAWATDMRNLRSPLGALRKRSLVGTRYARDLPEAPPGEYIVVQYSSSYENFPAVLETVVPMRDDDGAWRVAGYFIRGDIRPAPSKE